MRGRRYESRPGALTQRRAREAAERARELIAGAETEVIERAGTRYVLRRLPEAKPGTPGPTQLAPRSPYAKRIA